MNAPGEGSEGSARIRRVRRGAVIRLVLAVVCFVLSGLAFRVALVRLLGAMIAWLAATFTFGLGSVLLLSVAWGALRGWLEGRRQRRHHAA